MGCHVCLLLFPFFCLSSLVMSALELFSFLSPSLGGHVRPFSDLCPFSSLRVDGRVWPGQRWTGYGPWCGTHAFDQSIPTLTVVVHTLPSPACLRYLQQGEMAGVTYWDASRQKQSQNPVHWRILEGGAPVSKKGRLAGGAQADGAFGKSNLESYLGLLG